MGKIKNAVLVKEESNELEIMESRLVNISIDDNDNYIAVEYPDDTYGDELISINFEGEFDEKSFALNDDYDWEIVRDELGNLVLVPLKK